MTEDRHQQRQQKLKDQVDARIAAAEQDKGLLLVLTGNGKGKTSSGFGMVLRTVGHGKKLPWCNLLKAAGPAVSVICWNRLAFLLPSWPPALPGRRKTALWIWRQPPQSGNKPSSI